MSPPRLFVAVAILLSVSFPASADRIVVFAAASAANALSDIAALYRGRGNVATSHAASSALARQIAAGAPADVFISANPRWMDYLEGEKAIVEGSRRNLFGNALVLAAPRDGAFSWTPGGPLALDRLAMGDPDHVPAGIYGRAALLSLGLWPALKGKVVAAMDVRAALALAERGEVDAALVYASDARASNRVRLAAEIPADSHPPIVYPAAMVAGRDAPAVRRFFEFLASPEAARAFESAGFTVLER